MSITNHIAVLTYHALAQALPNKKKAGHPLQYFAVIALPPAAQDDLKALLTSVAPGGSLNGVDVRVPRNANTAKPIPGVPGDWFIIRAATQFPPYLADEAGKQLDQTTQAGDIRIKFYPGKRVRVALGAYAWNYQGKPGISFNLNGVMAVSGDSERLSIGNNAANEFADYAETGGNTANPFAGAPSNTTPAAAPSGSSAGAGADPFQQAAPGATGTHAAANPFA